MNAGKKRRTGRSVGSEPAPKFDPDSLGLGSFDVKIIHRPMPIPADREVSGDEILKRRDRDKR